MDQFDAAAISYAYTTKDSGAREEFTSGMVRDTQKGKPRYDLIDRAFLKRWAELMGRGAEKYGENNWRKASGNSELQRFEASATRHLFQWLDGDTSEDHAAAVTFNLAGAEMVKEKLRCETVKAEQPLVKKCCGDCPAQWGECICTQACTGPKKIIESCGGTCCE